ncbi:tetratricopeptide repeat protein, partial [Streptomyces collinus]
DTADRSETADGADTADRSGTADGADTADRSGTADGADTADRSGTAGGAGLEAFEAALTQLDRAAELFGTLGAQGLHSRTGAELAAGGIEADLGRPAAAAARARGVLAAYEGADAADETVRARRAGAERLLRPERPVA